MAAREATLTARRVRLGPRPAPPDHQAPGAAGRGLEGLLHHGVRGFLRISAHRPPVDGQSAGFGGHVDHIAIA